jgi:hypothetical protein
VHLIHHVGFCSIQSPPLILKFAAKLEPIEVESHMGSKVKDMLLIWLLKY